jgi:hypothetical protein
MSEALVKKRRRGISRLRQTLLNQDVNYDLKAHTFWLTLFMLTMAHAHRDADVCTICFN